MISVNDTKDIHLLPIFHTFQSFPYCKYIYISQPFIKKVIPILLILLQKLVKLFFSNGIIDILHNLRQFAETIAISSTLWSSPAPWKKFAKCLLLYSVSCVAYSNSHQGWDSLKFINDKNFNGSTLSNTYFYFKTPNFYFLIYFQPL